MNNYLVVKAITAMSPAPEGAPGAGGNALVMFVFYFGLFAIFYFLLIRPQMKRSKETKKMQETLGKGDSIVTTGGIYGVIHKMKDDVVTLEIADGVRIKIQRSGIGNRVSEVEKADESK